MDACYTKKKNLKFQGYTPIASSAYSTLARVIALNFNSRHSECHSVSSPSPPLSFLFGVGGATLVHYHGPGFRSVFWEGLLCCVGCLLYLARPISRMVKQGFI